MSELTQVTMTKYLVEFLKKSDKFDSDGKTIELGFINILYPSNIKLSIESFALLRAPTICTTADIIRVHKRE